jgi:hypothetical protein
LVIRDDFGGHVGRTPSFNYWSLSEDVAISGNHAVFDGQLGVDTQMFVAVPKSARLHKDSFTHDQCEPIVGRIHRERYGKAFSEKLVLGRAEGQKDQGFLVALFPCHENEPRPTIERWLGGSGVKVTWKDQTHYVLLDTAVRQVDANGIRAKTSALVAKFQSGRPVSITLPAGGTGSASELQVAAKESQPAEAALTDGRPRVVRGRNLMDPW